MRDDNINDGGPAFPANSDEWDNDAERYRPCSVGGMSLRDYFAAKALQGLVSDNKNFIQLNGAVHTTETLAAESYKLAGAMLKARQS